MKKTSLLIIVISGIIAIMVQPIVYGSINNKKNTMDEEKRIIEGRKRLASLEQADLSNIEEAIEKHHNIGAVNVNENVDFYKFYENTVFMGDSIVEGLAEWEILNKYNVVAEKGNTVLKGLDNVDKVAGLRPKNIVLLYGMNDVITFNGGGAGGPEAFKANYIKLVEKLKTAIPNTKIFIQAPLPVLDTAQNTNKRLTNTNLDEFRKLAKEVSEETQVKYVDTDSLVRENKELYEPDGIHFTYSFYDKWLSYLHNIIS